MTWEEVLKRDDIVGGDLETSEDAIYRGPIEAIKIEDGLVMITCSWMARMPKVATPDSARWTKWHATSCTARADEEPSDLGDGRVQFSIPMLGTAVIIPKGGSKLDPTKVEGLVLP